MVGPKFFIITIRVNLVKKKNKSLDINCIVNIIITHRKGNHMKLLITLGVVLFLIVGLAGWFISISNREVEMRNLIVAKQKANEVQFDNLWKSLTESFEITSAQSKNIKDIIVGYAEARTNKNGGSLATLVHEQVPNVDKTSEAFQNLMNVVVSMRATWTRKQEELIDFKREHDNLIDKFPSSLVCAILGKKKIDIVVVTSDRAEDAFKDGKDNGTNHFQSSTEK